MRVKPIHILQEYARKTKALSLVVLLLSTHLLAAAQDDKGDSLKHERRLGEVVVSMRTRKLDAADIGVEHVQLKEMHNLPSLFGERDIIRQLQLLPGVKAESDGSSGFQVRGGKAGQNHILLDDATVYNAGHLMGLFSTFNDEVLASVNLYKGTPPAQFGDGSSSVLNVVTKNGKPDWGISGTVGLLSAKLCLDIPIGDKVKVFLAARRTYFDLFLKMTKKFRGTTINFYDLNAKVSYDINLRNRIFVSFFRGRDNMGMDDMMQSEWGNMLGNIRYWHEFNGRHEMTTSVFLSTYDFDADTDMADIANQYGTGIKHVGLKQSFLWRPVQPLEISYGLQTRYTSLTSLNLFSQERRRMEQRRAWDNALWLNAEWKPFSKLTLLAGLRANIFSALGGSPYYDLDAQGNILHTYNPSKGEFVKTHVTLEPRFSANYRVSSSGSIKLGYARVGQNIRMLYNNGMSTTFNRYTMSSNIIRPELAHLVSVGYTHMLKGGAYEFSAEAYYKAMTNVLDYRNGKNFASEVEVERILLDGKGRSYGVELLARKNTGKLTGWMSYTLSWVENKIDGINDGQWYTASNDRRHDVSIAAMYQLTPKWTLSATWTLQSGQALSAPSAKYDVNGQTIYYYHERNGYRAPAYHRLDIAATWHRNHLTKRGRRWESEWAFGVYNVYNRYNPYVITFKNNHNRPTGTKATVTALFGTLPSVSYTFTF